MNNAPLRISLAAAFVAAWLLAPPAHAQSDDEPGQADAADASNELGDRSNDESEDAATQPEGARRRGLRGRGGRFGQGGRRRGRGGRRGPPIDEPVNRTTDLMLSEFHAHDPFIVPYAPTQTYYLFSAGRNDDGRATVVAYKSPDLKIWEGPQTVFTVPDGTWANPRDGARAPEVHEYNGKYYLFVTLDNRDAIFAEPPDVWRVNHLRGTAIAVADEPTGPFELLRTDAPHPPQEFMTVDGTLYVDPQGKPWMVYGHDWIQVIDGMFEAVPLTDDLSGTDADPIYLFKASDGPWLATQDRVTADQRLYVSDGPELFRTRDDHLLMLWSTHTVRDGYIQAVARSKSGTLAGPWEQLDPLVREDSGHGMLFRTFAGNLMMVLHRPYGRRARAKLYDLEDAGDQLRVLQHREDLDTRPRPADEQEGGFRRGRFGNAADEQAAEDDEDQRGDDEADDLQDQPDEPIDD